MLSPHSAQMSKITNDSLTRSGTGCFVAVPIWKQWSQNDLYCVEWDAKPYAQSFHCYSELACLFALTQ